MALDEDKYLHHLSDMELSDAAKRALIRDLWGMLSCIADIAFEIDPQQQAVDKAKTNLGSGRRRRLDSYPDPNTEPYDQRGPE